MTIVRGHVGPPVLVNALVMALWLVLFHPVLQWLGFIFSASDFRLNQLLLVGVAALLVRQMRVGNLRPNPGARIRPHGPALALVVGSAAGFVLAARFLDVNIVEGVLFGLGTYGLLGLWMRPEVWRRGLVAALLVVAVLPFGTHMQTFVGYPLRILTAQIVSSGLMAVGLTNTTADTIVVLESGLAQVDLPCSGVRSLWTGGVFLLAATWIERRKLGLPWLLVAVVFALLLFFANLTRVAALVLVGQAAQMPVAADLIHVPMGVLGFVAACVCGVWLVRRLPETSAVPADQPADVAPSHPPERRAAPLFGLGLATLLAVLAVAYEPRPQVGLVEAPPDWSFPDSLHIEPLPLRADEKSWLMRDGAESATRLKFASAGVTGSMILITSYTWRAHHLPERCYEVFGLKIDGSLTHMAAPDFPLKVVSIGRGHQSAAYWFQSVGSITDDYSTRMWADLAARERWVLVSVLFDRAVEPSSPEARGVYAALRAAVAANLAVAPPVAVLQGGLP